MNIASLDLNLLLVFEALVEERQVSRAARRIGLSQPAVSNALGRLRGFFNDPLFVRSASGMRLTPRAEQFRVPVTEALARIREALEDPRQFEPMSTVRRFRIALSDDLELRLAPVFALHLASGGLSLQTRRLEGLFQIPEAALQQGAVDLAIGYFPDARAASGGVALESIGEERNVVVGRRGHPALRRRITLETFAELEHAAIIYANEPSGLIDRELASKGLRRRLRLALPHLMSVLEAVSRSDLIACVQETAAQNWRDALKLSLQPEPLGLPPFVIRMAWHRHAATDPAHIWLRNVCRAGLRNHAQP